MKKTCRKGLHSKQGPGRCPECKREKKRRHRSQMAVKARTWTKKCRCGIHEKRGKGRCLECASEKIDARLSEKIIREARPRKCRKGLHDRPGPGPCKPCARARDTKKKALARRDHPERKREDDARRRKAHPERFIARDQEHDRIRRARAMGCSTVTVSPEFLTALFDSQGGRCHYCRKRLDTSAAPWRSSKFKHLDHIVSHAKGGPHSPANVCWACGPCDQRKRNRERDEFIGARALFAHATISFS